MKYYFLIYKDKREHIMQGSLKALRKEIAKGYMTEYKLYESNDVEDWAYYRKKVENV